MTRFVPRSKAARQQLVPERDRVYVGAAVRLSCGCRTTRVPAYVKAGGVEMHWCPLHPGGFRKAVR